MIQCIMEMEPSVVWSKKAEGKGADQYLPYDKNENYIVQAQWARGPKVLVQVNMYRPFWPKFVFFSSLYICL